ncbi:hypothetical protein L596_001431 [Steinernema carpocapsae]|uniref:SLED domain-containing protein n=1 Tax=Steinernema carpocapsae TaxID=34508 RepID=A0A4U8UN95_STECR|nr:hypothetical protein L596_001431 [Steinernema carpocapsae]
MNGTAMISSSVSTPSHSLSPPVAPPVDHDRELMPPPAITKVKRKAQKEARRAAKRQAKAEKAEKAARAELVQAQLDQLVAAQAMASETKTSEDNVDGEPPRKIIKKILFKEPTLPASPVFARAPVSIFVPSKKTPEVVLPPPLAMMSLAPALPKVDSLKVAEPLVVHPKPVDKKPTLPEETDLAPGCSGSPSSSVIPTKPTLVVEPKATPAAQSKPISITPPKPPVFLLKPVEQKPTLPKTGSSCSSDDQPKPTPTAQPKIPVVQSQPLQQEPKLPEAVSDRSGFASFSALQPKPSDIFQAKPSSTAQPKPPVVEQPKPVKQKTTMPEAVPGPSGLAYSSAVQPKPKATSIVQPKPVNAAQSKPLEQKPNLTEAVPSCSGLARSLTVQPKASPVIQLKETSTAQQLPVVHSKPADQKTKMPEPVLGPSGLASSSAIHSKSATAAQPKPPAVQPKPVKQKPTLPSAKPKAPKATAPEPKPAVAKPQAEVEIINAPGKEPNAKAVAAANAMSPRSTPADGVREDVVIIPKDIRGVAPSLMLFINHGCARQSEYMDIRKIQTIQKKVGPSSAHHLLREVMQGLVNAASYLHLAHVYRKIPQGPHGGHLNITCSVGNMTYLRYLPTPGTVPGVVTVIRDFLKDVNVCPNFVSTSGQECPNCRRVFRRDPPAQPLEFESWDVETMGEYAQGIVGGNIKESFIEHGIDGQALKWLTMEQIRSMLHLQLGPALKLFHLKDTFERSQHQNVPQPQPL